MSTGQRSIQALPFKWHLILQLRPSLPDFPVDTYDAMEHLEVCRTLIYGLSCHRNVLIRLPAFRTASRPFAAQNFTMPAMSPTMTEGNIASWKVKEG